jgi:hypothetical protein
VSPQASINTNRLVSFQCSIDVNSNGKLENSTCHEVQDLTLLQLCHTASAVRVVRSRDSDLNPQLGQCTMSGGGSMWLTSQPANLLPLNQIEGLAIAGDISCNYI